MHQFKVNDVVIIKERTDWPSPPGYDLADSIGEIVSVMSEEGFVTLRLTKTARTKLAEGTTLVLRIENIEKA